MATTERPIVQSAHTTTVDITQSTSDRRAQTAYTLALLGVLIGAALLRLGGIGFGLPHLYHWDERAYFHSAFYTLASGGRAESLVPGNVPYLMVPTLWIMAALNGLPLWGSGISRLVTLYLNDPTPFYLIGRIMWVGLQLLAIVLTYTLGGRTLSQRAGLLAAAFLSAAFIVVSEGHYIKGDSAAMLGAVLTAWAAIRLLEQPTARRYALLGAAIGLTIAFKFYTYSLLALPLIMHLVSWPDWTARRREWRKLLWSAAGALTAFLVSMPTILVDPIGTWDTFALEYGVRLASLPTGGVPIWLYYWTGHLWDGVGWPFVLCGLGGFALWALCVRRDPRRLTLIAMAVLLWLGVISRENQFARYTLPIVPFLALAAGDLLDRAASALSGRLRERGVLAGIVTPGLVILAPLLMVPSLLNDIRFDAYASSLDTRTTAAAWVEHNIPAGATIVAEAGQGFEAMSNLGPPLRAAPSAVGKTWAPTKLKPHDEYWSEPLLKWLDAYTPTYNLTFAFTLTRDKEKTTTEQWGSPDAFVIISWRSDPEKGTPPSPLWDDLHRKYAMAARFDCSPCLGSDPYAFTVDYSTLVQVSVLRGGNISGPRIWVYTRR